MRNDEGLTSVHEMAVLEAVEFLRGVVADDSVSTDDRIEAAGVLLMAARHRDKQTDGLDELSRGTAELTRGTAELADSLKALNAAPANVASF